MIQLFKKANDKAGSEVDPKDPTKQKWNADAVFVQIENEMVPLSELAKHAKENDYEAVQTVENELEINGALHNVSDLIERYKASKANAEETAEEKAKKEQAKKNADEDEAKKKKEEEEKNKKNETEEEKKAREDKENAKKNEEEELKKKMDEEEKIKKQAKENEIAEEAARHNGKDLKHFVRLNIARENGSATNVLTIDTQKNRIDRGRNRYGSDA